MVSHLHAAPYAAEDVLVCPLPETGASIHSLYPQAGLVDTAQSFVSVRHARVYLRLVLLSAVQTVTRPRLSWSHATANRATGMTKEVYCAEREEVQDATYDQAVTVLEVRTATAHRYRTDGMDLDCDCDCDCD